MQTAQPDQRDDTLLLSKFSEQLKKFSRLHLQVGLSPLTTIEDCNTSTRLFMEQVSINIQKLQEKAEQLFHENYGFKTTKERLQLLYNEAVALERTASLLEDYTAMLENRFYQQALDKSLTRPE
ncbi:hypothetical protein GpartN1_g4679.t1 [Galdieria partita]|uniref:Uncharacterized protein n=1 Tax=Galdieria partita TaxID=83374 RepID=A0A9C7PY32_9RHOD|nr:hypothetical protein GpartN1_g4679.t1 [Galdieria partita]